MFKIGDIITPEPKWVSSSFLYKKFKGDIMTIRKIVKREDGTFSYKVLENDVIWYMDHVILNPTIFLEEKEFKV